MRYRNLGQTGLRTSVLGFGAMRLPFDDEDRSAAIIRRAFERGVTYVDTAWVYGDGRSERIVGAALRGYRDEVTVVTKSPTWEINETSDYRRILEAQLARLDTDHIDVYLFHGIGRESYENKILGLGLLEEATRARDEGLIRHIGFSFHDEPEAMRPIIDGGVVELVLCQYNLLDRKNQEMMHYAHERGLGVVVMGPIGGGRLGEPSRAIQALLPEAPATSAALALRFVLSNPDVDCVISGMGSEEMVEENVEVAMQTALLTDDELARIERAATENARLAELYCTGCKYCLPCPYEVNIPLNFELMNLHRVHDITAYARAEYAKIGQEFWLPGKQADACTECGECEEKCPQNIPIRVQLQETARTLG